MVRCAFQFSVKAVIDWGKKKKKDQQVIYGKGFKSYLEINRNKTTLKCIFPKNMQPIRRASLAIGKLVLLDLPQKAIKKIVLYIEDLKTNSKKLLFY